MRSASVPHREEDVRRHFGEQISSARRAYLDLQVNLPAEAESIKLLRRVRSRLRPALSTSTVFARAHRSPATLLEHQKQTRRAATIASAENPGAGNIDAPSSTLRTIVEL
jgi:hypothetical protein